MIYYETEWDYRIPTASLSSHFGKTIKYTREKQVQLHNTYATLFHFLRWFGFWQKNIMYTKTRNKSARGDLAPKSPQLCNGGRPTRENNDISNTPEITFNMLHVRTKTLS